MKRIITMLLLFCVLWCGSVSAVAEGTTTENGAKGATVTAQTELKNAPSFSLSIPTGIPIGEITRTAESTLHEVDFEISVSALANFENTRLTVIVGAPTDRFCLYNGLNELPYRLLRENAEMHCGDTFAVFESAATVTGNIALDRADIRAEGTYNGSIIFTVKTERLTAE